MKLRLLWLASTVLADPTLWYAGDSSMKNTSPTKARVRNIKSFGWSRFFGDNLDPHQITTRDLAKPRASARSFLRDGYFDFIAKHMEPEDYVIIQFGHFDYCDSCYDRNGKAPNQLRCDNGLVANRPYTDLDNPSNPYDAKLKLWTDDYKPHGRSWRECSWEFHAPGGKETLLTFHAYMVKAARMLKSKGANVIIASPTPHINPCHGPICKYEPWEVNKWAKDAAADAGVLFIDHGQLAANALLELARKEYEIGHLMVDMIYHKTRKAVPWNTNERGAKLFSNAFLKGLMATNSSLKSYIKDW